MRAQKDKLSQADTKIRRSAPVEFDKLVDLKHAVRVSVVDFIHALHEILDVAINC